MCVIRLSVSVRKGAPCSGRGHGWHRSEPHEVNTHAFARPRWGGHSVPGDQLLCEGQSSLLASAPSRGTLYGAVTSRRVSAGLLSPLRSLGPWHVCAQGSPWWPWALRGPRSSLWRAQPQWWVGGIGLDTAVGVCLPVPSSLQQGGDRWGRVWGRCLLCLHQAVVLPQLWVISRGQYPPS